ncbi:MAG: hypothetical protein ACKVX7_17745 [Planctomycetota bacterium]
MKLPIFSGMCVFLAAIAATYFCCALPPCEKAVKISTLVETATTGEYCPPGFFCPAYTIWAYSWDCEPNPNTVCLETIICVETTKEKFSYECTDVGGTRVCLRVDTEVLDFGCKKYTSNGQCGGEG